ncbi:MAG: hypothetical protein ACLR8U_04745 [Oscillospiraceae bacterium]
MSEKMYPIPFKSLMNWIVTEYAREGEIFGVHTPTMLPAKRSPSSASALRPRSVPQPVPTASWRRTSSPLIWQARASSK